MLRQIFTLCSTIILAIGCGAQNAPVTARYGGDIPPNIRLRLHNATHYELFALDPAAPATRPADAFLGWRVVGQTEIQSVGTRRGLNAALRVAAIDSLSSAMAPFRPEYGIRVKQYYGPSLELLISCESWEAKAYEHGQLIYWFLIDPNADLVFDEALKQAGLRASRPGH